jgi:hypothetical protein
VLVAEVEEALYQLDLGWVEKMKEWENDMQ